MAEIKQTAYQERKSKFYEEVKNKFLELQAEYPDAPKSRIYYTIAEDYGYTQNGIRKILLTLGVTTKN